MAFNRKNYLSALLIAPIACQTAYSLQKDIEKIRDTTPSEIYRSFNNLSIPAFVIPSFTMKGLDKDGFGKWQAYAQAANQFVRMEVGRSLAPRSYSSTITVLDGILEAIESTANGLHKRNITAGDKAQIKKMLESDIRDSNFIEKTMADAIGKEVGIPAAWKQEAKASNLKIQTDRRTYIPYETFFASWDAAEKATRTKRFTPQETLDFLSKNNITRFNIDGAIDTMDFIAYRLQKEVAQLTEELKTSWFGNDKRKKTIAADLEFITKAQEVAKRIREAYLTTSKLFALQLNETKNQAATILYAQASIYQVALNQLLKELNAIK